MKIQFLTFDLGVRVTENVSQYPLYHVTYSDTKLEAATSNSFYKKSYHIIIGFLINVQVQGHHPHQWAPFQVTG